MENSTKKKLVFAGLGMAVLLLINRAGEVNDTVNGLTFKFGIGGAPKISGLSIMFPVKMDVSNPGNVTLPLSGLAMKLGRLYPNGSVVALAATDPAGVPAQNIVARSVTSIIVPVHTDVLSVLTEVISAIKGGGLGRYRLSPSIISGGLKINLPDQTLTY